jgi:tol-pal system-associated acyl-CoA thioesterase
MSKFFEHKVRIYYEDTDFGGVVYYANYLKFAERARTEMLRSLGINQNILAQSSNILFVVKDCKITYKASSSIDDELRVVSNVVKCSGASLQIKQQIFLIDKLITDIDVLIVSVNDKFQVVKIPADLKNKFIS